MTTFSDEMEERLQRFEAQYGHRGGRFIAEGMTAQGYTPIAPPKEPHVRFRFEGPRLGSSWYLFPASLLSYSTHPEIAGFLSDLLGGEPTFGLDYNSEDIDDALKLTERLGQFLTEA